MYNSEIPNREELPSARRLLRSTLLALVAALVILVTMVLPAEYGIDPTGIGRVLGLAEMGEIKAQLAEEAEADRQQHAERAETARKQSMLDQTLGFFFASAHAQTSEDGTARPFCRYPGAGGLRGGKADHGRGRGCQLPLAGGRWFDQL